MLIEKGVLQKETCKDKQRYYENARGSMLDWIQAMYNEGLINKVLLSGYIGWLPREGSGIFEKASNSETVVLVVNYFSIRDENISEIICRLKKRGVWIIEDNAHGMYTYFKCGRKGG